MGVIDMWKPLESSRVMDPIGLRKKSWLPFFLADGCDEVDSKPAHAKPAYAAPNLVPEVCICVTRHSTAPEIS